MFQSTIDMTMVLEINQLLKKHQLDYEVHSFSGCSSCGLNLIKHQINNEEDKVLQVINQYLSKKWLKAEIVNHTIFINSKFE